MATPTSRSTGMQTLSKFSTPQLEKPTSRLAPTACFGATCRETSFVAASIFGIDLATLGNRADSGLVDALRSQTPFGSDTPCDGAKFDATVAAAQPAQREKRAPSRALAPGAGKPIASS